MKELNTVAVVLVLVGALNWGLVALLNLNLVTLIVGTVPSVEKLVYVAVGASAVYVALTNKCLWGGKGKK